MPGATQSNSIKSPLPRGLVVARIWKVQRFAVFLGVGFDQACSIIARTALKQDIAATPARGKLSSRSTIPDGPLAALRRRAETRCCQLLALGRAVWIRAQPLKTACARTTRIIGVMKSPVLTASRTVQQVIGARRQMLAFGLRRGAKRASS